MHFLQLLEDSTFATWVRESSSIWAYPTILFLHTCGMAFLVGTNAAIDLRILGFGSRMRLSPMEGFYPVMWVSFWVNAVSGTALVVANATTKLISPVFYVKMAFIFLAVGTMVLIRRRVLRDPNIDSGSTPMSGKLLALASLLFWAGAITAGRLLAYIGPGAEGLKAQL